MIRTSVVYEVRSGAEEFDAYYFGTHVPLVNKIPGLDRFEAVVNGPGPDGSAPRFHLIAGLYFSDGAALEAGMGSGEGQTVVADVENFPGDWDVTIVAGEIVDG